MQLAIYGWLYEQTFGVAPIAIQVHTGAGTVDDVPYEGAEEALATLARIRELRGLTTEPREMVGWGKCSSCGFFERCWPRAVERALGRPSALGRSRPDHRARRPRNEHDRRTCSRASIEDSLAELERPWGRRRQQVGLKSGRILASARALAENRPIVLKEPADPEPSDLHHVRPRGDAAILDELEKIYIWGMQPFGEPAGRFRAATAGFGRRRRSRGLGGVSAGGGGDVPRVRRYPFVHWASYELAKINMYISRYGDRDGIAARVKRNLLDLLPITYESVALPVSNYGLKTIEQARRLSSGSSPSPAASGQWPAISRPRRPTTLRAARQDHGRDPCVQPGGSRGDVGGAALVRGGRRCASCLVGRSDSSRYHARIVERVRLVGQPPRFRKGVQDGLVLQAPVVEPRCAQSRACGASDRSNPRVETPARRYRPLRGTG